MPSGRVTTWSSRIVRNVLVGVSVQVIAANANFAARASNLATMNSAKRAPPANTARMVFPAYHAVRANSRVTIKAIPAQTACLASMLRTQALPLAPLANMADTSHPRVL